MPSRGGQALTPTPLPYYNFITPNGVRFQERISLERGGQSGVPGHHLLRSRKPILHSRNAFRRRGVAKVTFQETTFCVPGNRSCIPGRHFA